MRVGIDVDHWGFTLKGQVAKSLRGSGDQVVDFGAHLLNPEFGGREEIAARKGGA